MMLILGVLTVLIVMYAALNLSECKKTHTILRFWWLFIAVIMMFISAYNK